jgi:WD40 repeat protein
MSPNGRRQQARRRGARQCWCGSNPLELSRDNPVSAVAGLSHGRVSGGCDGRVLVWDPAAPGSAPVELGRHDGLTRSVAVLSDGRVVSGGSDGRVRVWDPSEPGSDPVELGGHDHQVRAVAVLADGRVVSGEADGRVWTTTAQGQVAQLGCSVIGLVAVQASRSEASLVVVHDGHGFSVWSVARDHSEPC